MFVLNGVIINIFCGLPEVSDVENVQIWKSSVRKTSRELVGRFESNLIGCKKKKNPQVDLNFGLHSI